MDKVSKHRLTGAAVWLVLLVVIVPIWFSQPVNFKPEGYVDKGVTAERPLVDHAYVIPESAVKNRAIPVAKPVKVKPVVKVTKVKQTDSKSRPETKLENKSRWIVRIIAYRDIKNANDLLGRLESHYEVYIKTFAKSGVHSVRAGPYISKAKAEQDKKKLDKMLHAKTEIVQLK